MTFLELQTEFYARGFDDLNQAAADRTRAKRWLNEGYIEDICDPWPWPFLETATSAASPATVTNIKDILYVTDTNNNTRLTSGDLRDIIDSDADVDATSTGTPHSYYLDGDVIKVYPVGSVTLGIRYIKIPAELSADGDTPVLPTRYHPLIVDAAVIRGNRDNDNHEAVAALQAQFDRRLNNMVDAMFSRNLDNSQYIQSTWAYG